MERDLLVDYVDKELEALTRTRCCSPEGGHVAHTADGHDVARGKVGHHVQVDLRGVLVRKHRGVLAQDIAPVLHQDGVVDS